MSDTLKREMGREIVRRQRFSELGPYNKQLTQARQHCEIVHGATMLDYRLDVVGWHNNNQPDCDWTAPLATDDE